tara:strand:+ start:348 stop:521 length:174 start_codon:yes stop_codon:yes gene_type:complete
MDDISQERLDRSNDPVSDNNSDFSDGSDSSGGSQDKPDRKEIKLLDKQGVLKYLLHL